MTQNIRVWQAEMLPANQANKVGKLVGKRFQKIVWRSFLYTSANAWQIPQRAKWIKELSKQNQQKTSENGQRTWKISSPKGYLIFKNQEKLLQSVLMRSCKFLFFSARRQREKEEKTNTQKEFEMNHLFKVVE